MALRNITVRGSEILTKKCKPIKAITPRIRELAEDMVETMIAADGVGIAAPQVGVMKRFFVTRWLTSRATCLPSARRRVVTAERPFVT